MATTSEKIVVGAVLRAGLLLHQGLVDFFDNVGISLYQHLEKTPIPGYRPW